MLSVSVQYILMRITLSTSHLVTAMPGTLLLSEALLSSPILAGEDGAPIAPMGQGFEFGIDPAEDPELAMVRARVRVVCWPVSDHLSATTYSPSPPTHTHTSPGSESVHGGTEAQTRGGSQKSAG